MYIATLESATAVPVKSSRIVVPPVVLVTARIVISQTKLLELPPELGQLFELANAVLLLLSSITLARPLPDIFRNTFPCAVEFEPTRIPSCLDDPEIAISSSVLFGESMVTAAVGFVALEQFSPWTPRVFATFPLGPDPLTKQVATFDIVR